LRGLGHSRHSIALALERGMLARVRRDWVALPSADAELMAAARWGVVLTCVTLARRLGLWVLEEDRCHVAAAPHATGRKPRLATVHWSQPVVPRHPDALVDSLENALILIAQCQPRESALATWESALGQGMVSLEELKRLPLTGSGLAVRARGDHAGCRAGAAPPELTARTCDNLGVLPIVGDASRDASEAVQNSEVVCPNPGGCVRISAAARPRRPEPGPSRPPRRRRAPHRRPTSSSPR
jgi:hypothetical protein